MSAVDDRGIKINDTDNMSPIGQDNAKVSVANTNVVDMRAHFGGAHGPGYQPVAMAAPSIQPQQEPQGPQSQDLWANTGPQRNPLLDGIDQVSNNMAGAGPLMNSNVKMDGAGYLANSVGSMAVELFGSLTKEAAVTPPQYHYQQPAPGLFS